MTEHNRPRWPFPEHGALTAHPKGKWCKWIKGRTEYFGHWRNPDPGNEWAKTALRRYLDFTRAAQDEQKATVAGSDLTIEIAANHFLSARATDVAAGKLGQRQFTYYRQVGRLVLKTLGRSVRVTDLGPADFVRLRRAIQDSGELGAVSVGNRVQWIRTMFRWVDEFYGVKPRYGGQFNKPPRREVRLGRRQRNLFTAVEIRRMIAKASPAVKCFILLGINCGFGQTDCATVPRTAFDFRKRMLVWRRGKTGVNRACPLWPETVKALRAYRRPHTAELPLMFITEKMGHRWVREVAVRDETGQVERVKYLDAISPEVRYVAEMAKVKPRGFYTFRHTFRTMAEGTGDLNAVRVIMGQSFSGLDDFYLHLDQRPDYQRRLRKVTDAVRKWVFGK